jgi:hypothetical protein
VFERKGLRFVNSHRVSMLAHCGKKTLSLGFLSESHVHILRWELKMHHLSRKVLSCCIMYSNRAIFATGDK